MDATPVTLGQEFGGYAAAVRNGVERLRASLPRVGELPLGGTAVGTGINTPPGFAAAVIARLAGELDLPLTEARDHFEAQSSRDGLVEASGAAAHHRRRPLQDRQRPALDGLRAARPGSARSSCPTSSRAARSCPARSTRSPRGPVARSPPRSSATTPPSPSAAPPGNFELNVMLPVIGPQRARVHPAAANVSAAARRPLHRRHRRRRGRCRELRRVLAVDRHAAEQLHRLRGGGRGRQAVAQGGEDHPPGRPRAGLRRGRASSPRSSSTTRSTSSR